LNENKELNEQKIKEHTELINKNNDEIIKSNEIISNKTKELNDLQQKFNQQINELQQIHENQKNDLQQKNW